MTPPLPHLMTPPPPLPFDLLACPQVLGFQQRSLASLLLRFCGISADKSLGQRADWRQRCGCRGRGGHAPAAPGQLADAPCRFHTCRCHARLLEGMLQRLSADPLPALYLPALPAGRCQPI